jgi:hypothetical protein
LKEYENVDKKNNTNSILLLGLLVLAFILLNITLTSHYYSQYPLFWYLLIPILFTILWPFIGMTVMYQFDIQTFKLRFFLFVGEIFFLLLLSWIIIVSLFGLTRLFIQEVFKMDIFSDVYIYTKNIPFSFDMQFIIFGPLWEEMAKIIPLFIISYKGPLKLFNKYYKHELIDLSSRSQVILYGLISGTIFTTLEFYIYYFCLSNQQIFQFSRFLTPVHVLTTTILALGISMIIRSQKTRNDKNATVILNSYFFVRIIPVFLFSWFTHSLWNALPLLGSYIVYSRYYENKYFEIIGQIQNDTIFMFMIIFGICSNIIILLTVVCNRTSNSRLEL